MIRIGITTAAFEAIDAVAQEPSRPWWRLVG
jgi:hypothetical protein